MRMLVVVSAFLTMILAGCAHHEIHRDGQTVILTLRAPQARDVQFASSLDGFLLHPARPLGGSTWEVRVPDGSPFRYFYLVDKEVYVPECRFSEADDFGSRDCIYIPCM